MIKQYCRFYVNPATREITHCATQMLPFADAFDPIDPVGRGTLEVIDCEIGCDLPDSDFGPGQKMISARQLIDALEAPNQNQKPVIRAGAPRAIANKIRSVGDPKDISETNVKAELIARAEQLAAANGQTVDDLVAAIRARGRRIDALSDLPLVALMRAVKVLENRQ